MKKLYVGNIPWKMSEEDLKQTFAGLGTVKEAKIIVEKLKNPVVLVL